VLEQRLCAMVGHVERDGNRLIVSGLGPSSRVINRHDTTVIDVWVEDGVTAIGADVSFQASAFLGDTGQEEIMRLKLDRLFEETEEQLDFERRRAKARIARMQMLASTGATAAVYARVNERERESLALVSHDATTHEQYREVAHETAVDSLLDVVTPEPPETADPPADAAVISAAPLEDLADEKTETMKAAAASEVDDIMEEEVVEEDDFNFSRWIVWGVLAACLPAFLPFAVHYVSSMRTGTEVSRPVPAVSAPTVAASVPAGPIPAADPAELLRQWEMAMRSSDAAAQAAFYAVPVERYLTRANVSKEAVQADKQAQIDKRRGLWTMTMERVRISPQSDALVTVRLLKHYTEQENGKKVREWFVPSQLKLKNEYGIWWIISERDLGWALSPDDL